MPRSRKPGEGQESGFPEMEPVVEAVPEAQELDFSKMSIEAVAELVAARRAEALAAKPIPVIPAVTSQKTEAHRTFKGGAFGGALKRRIEGTDSATKHAATNDADIDAVTPLKIAKQLFHAQGDQVYRGLLFTPSEVGNLTFSAGTLVTRVSAKVHKGTAGRPAGDRFKRQQEVVQNGLLAQATKAENQIESLRVDEQVFDDLLKEIKTPGYAHMSQEDMDALMAHAEGVFVDMLEAIVTNQFQAMAASKGEVPDYDAVTARVNSLKAALDFMLSNDEGKNDYKKTFSYWRHMANFGRDWTRAKIQRFDLVANDVHEELKKRG